MQGKGKGEIDFEFHRTEAPGYIQVVIRWFGLCVRHVSSFVDFTGHRNCSEAWFNMDEAILGLSHRVGCQMVN